MLGSDLLTPQCRCHLCPLAHFLPPPLGPQTPRADLSPHASRLLAKAKSPGKASLQWD